MKNWTIALSIYIAFLAGMPCCIFDNCPDDKIAVEHHEDESDHQNGDEDGCGTCSPFFNCSTCNSLFIASNYSINLSIPLSMDAKTTRSKYLSVIPKNPLVKIWQPPKIS